MNSFVKWSAKINYENVIVVRAQIMYIFHQYSNFETNMTPFKVIALDSTILISEFQAFCQSIIQEIFLFSKSLNISTVCQCHFVWFIFDIVITGELRNMATTIVGNLPPKFAFRPDLWFSMERSSIKKYKSAKMTHAFKCPVRAQNMSLEIW